VYCFVDHCLSFRLFSFRHCICLSFNLRLLINYPLGTFKLSSIIKSIFILKTLLNAILFEAIPIYHHLSILVLSNNNRLLLGKGVNLSSDPRFIFDGLVLGGICVKLLC